MQVEGAVIVGRKRKLPAEAGVIVHIGLQGTRVPLRTPRHRRRRKLPSLELRRATMLIPSHSKAEEASNYIIENLRISMSRGERASMTINDYYRNAPQDCNAAKYEGSCERFSE